MMQWQIELDAAIEAARKAGSRLREIAETELEVISSRGRDIKLRADQESEKIIIETLGGVSDIPVLAEESGESEGFRDSECGWMIDPVDGTLNYSRGIPPCCVSIGLWEKDNPVLGVVYDFNRDECFYGVVGEGAWCDGKEIRVSGREDVSQAIIATGFPVNRDFGENGLQRFLNQAQKFKKVRMLGTAALSLAYVACGRVDVYTEEEIMMWDVAAGIALVLAAGGWVDIKRSERLVHARTVFAAASSSLQV